MKNNKKSAKDIAFDKERAAFRKRIRELEGEVYNQYVEIANMRDVISQKELLLAEKNDWIRRLLEYMDISEEDLRKIIRYEKVKADIYDSLGIMNKVSQKYFGF